MAVTGHARSLVDNRLAHAYKTVEKGGFADVRPAHDRY
jgi:hypothetical protein